MALIEEAHKAARLLLDHAYVRVVARAEPDAMCAAAVLAHALRRENVDFHLTWLDRLDETACEQLAQEKNDALVLLGLGGDAHADDPFASRKISLERGGGAFEAEAVLDPGHAVDHRTRASLASLAYLVGVAMSKRNRDLAFLALTGSLAQAHHLGGGLKGLDAEILAEALEADQVVREPALALHGHTLLLSLSQLDAPYVSGVTGRARNVKKLVADLGLSGDAPPHSLQRDDARRLGDFLTLRLLQQEAPDASLDALFRGRYRALQGPHAGLDASEMARAVETACLAGRCSLGFSALWPDPSAGAELGPLQHEARDQLVAALLRGEREGRREGRLLAIEAPSAAYCEPLAQRAAMSFAPVGCVAVAHHAGRFALRSVGDEADAIAAARHAARACGGRASGTRLSARLDAEEAERALKALAEALA